MPSLFDSLKGGITDIFGGRDDPRLSAEANRGSSRDALIRAGLTTLATTGGPSGLGATALEKIATGALTGREVGEASRAQALDVQRQQAVQAAVEGGADLNALFFQAIQQGDTDMARVMSEVIKSQTGSSPAAPTVIRSQFDPDLGTNMDVMFNKDTGEEIRTLGRSSLSGEGRAPRERKHWSEELQRDVISAVNPDGTNGAVLAFVDDGRSESSAIRAEMEAKAELVRGSAERLDQIDEFTRGFLPQWAATGNKFIKTAAGFALGSDWSPFKNEQVEEAVTESLNFVNVVVNYLSGKQMTQQEFDRYWTALIAGTGESDHGVAVKSRARALMVQAINEGRWEAVQDSEGNWQYQDLETTLQQVMSEANAAVGPRPAINPDSASAQLFGGN